MDGYSENDVVLDNEARAWQKRAGYWHLAGVHSRIPTPLDSIPGPVTVLVPSGQFPDYVRLEAKITGLEQESGRLRSQNADLAQTLSRGQHRQARLEAFLEIFTSQAADMLRAEDARG